MSYSVHYTTASGRHSIHFLLQEEGGRWQAYVLGGISILASRLSAGEIPPGCEHVNGACRIRWFSMTRISNQDQAASLAAWWAEDIEHFAESGKWQTRYRTNDGQDVFAFSIERNAGLLRVYIDDQPSYGGRDQDAHSTHRYSDGARRYICWDGSMRDWAEAEDVATAWAEHTQNYIRTGQGF